MEAYKKTVDIEENKTLTDAATGIRVTGDLPKGAELVVIDKSESGVKNALAAYLQNPAVKDYQNALSMVEIRIMVGGEVYTCLLYTAPGAARRFDAGLQGAAQGGQLF